MDELDEILLMIVSGQLERTNDEKNVGGLWDYARQIIDNSAEGDDGDLQANIYYALWDIVDKMRF